MRYIVPFLENSQQAKLLLSKLNLDPKNNEDYNKINKLLSGNGYMYWFCKLFFVDKVSFEELTNIWNIIKTEPQIISKFSKPVVNLKNLESFWDEYLSCKGLNNAKNIYNQFPSSQKKFINLKNNDDILLLNDLYKDKDKEFFIKKISRYHTKSSFIEALKLFLYNKSDNKFDSLLNLLKSDNINIKYYSDENDIIVCTVNYPQLRKYGADTSWCIVGSEGTFNSYNSEPLSQQFIIFLLDRNDNYSKIGITTNMKGIKTAHLKDDKYIKSEEIVNLLKTRKFDTSLLYPSKENASGISWAYCPFNVLKKIGFTDSEIIEKKRNDVLQLDWNSLSVYFLIKSGFNKFEIIKKKNLYGHYAQIYLNDDDVISGGTPPKTDLEFFTSEEINKYKLLEKTKLSFSDLNPYSKEEIIKKKLIYRVVGIKLFQLGELGFSYKEILKLSKDPIFQSDNLLKFISGKSREKVIKDSILYPFREVDNRTRDELIKLVGLTSDDVSFDRLYSAFRSGADYFQNIEKTIEFFSKIYKLTKDNISKIIFDNSRSKYPLILSEFIGKDFYRNECLDLLSSFISKEDRPDYNYLEMNIFKNNLVEYTDLYDEIFSKTKQYLLGGKYPNTYRLKITSEDRYGRSINIKSTLSNLNFWGATDTMSLKGIGDLFNYAKLRNSKEILDYCIKKGYDISGKEGFELASKLKDTHEEELDLLIFCIENFIDVDNCYSRLEEYMKSRKSKVSDWDKLRIEKLLKNKKGYENKWEEFVNQDIINDAIQQTKAASEYAWARAREKAKPETWYEKYWPIIKKLDFIKIKKDLKETDDVLFVSTVILLAKVNKIDEIDNIEYDFISNQGWSSFPGSNPLVDLAKVVADKHITNWKRTWIKLDESQRKNLFLWLDKKADEYIQKIEDPLPILRSMVVDWYIFNKEKLNNYIEKVKKIKNNYAYIGRGDVEKRKTIRLKELDKLFVYLGEEGKFDDLEKILNQFKLGKIEKKNTMTSIGRANLFYSRGEKDDIYNVDVTKDNKKRYKEIFDKYFNSQSIKESYILKWIDFNI